MLSIWHHLPLLLLVCDGVLGLLSTLSAKEEFMCTLGLVFKCYLSPLYLYVCFSKLVLFQHRVYRYSLLTESWITMKLLHNFLV